VIAGWRVVESTELHSGLAVQLVDDHTRAPVEAAVAVTLDQQQGAGWRELDLAPVVLPGATFFYPRLERYRDAAGRPPRRYRVRARSERYAPLYLALGAGGIEIDVLPWDADNPPADSLRQPVPLAMLPRPGLALGPLVPVLRGSITTAQGEPIGGALMSYDMPPPPPAPARPIRVLSEEDGEFALPIRGLFAPIVTVAVTPPGGGPPASFSFTWRDDVKRTHQLIL
jgi:hypothetical protein